MLTVRFKSIALWTRGKYSVKQILSTDLLPYNQVDQRYVYLRSPLFTTRTSVSLHGDHIVWATCAGVIILRNNQDEILDQVKVHSTQIWWIEVLSILNPFIVDK